MKWFVLCLVLVNAGVFLWFTFDEPDNVRSVDEGRLPRVAEIELLERQIRSDRPAGPEAAAEPREPADDRIAPEPAVGPGQEPASQTARAEQEVIVVERAEAVRQCFGIGWFGEVESAREYLQALRQTRSRLESLGITERVTPLEDFHWVLIPPLESRQAAMARYRELVERGIEAYVVPTGESENAISLGLFRSRQSAEDLLSRRQAENIDAVLANFPRNRISYALVFEGAPDRSLLTVEGGSAAGEGELQLIEFSDCEGVATAEKNP